MTYFRHDLPEEEWRHKIQDLVAYAKRELDGFDDYTVKNLEKLLEQRKGADNILRIARESAFASMQVQVAKYLNELSPRFTNFV